MDEALHAALRRGLEPFHKTQTGWQVLPLQGAPRDVAAGPVEASQNLCAILVALPFAAWAVGVLHILLLFLDLPTQLLLIALGQVLMKQILINLGQVPSCELWLTLKTLFYSIKCLLKPKQTKRGSAGKGEAATYLSTLEVLEYSLMRTELLKADSWLSPASSGRVGSVTSSLQVNRLWR